jgi:hypothetical protein
VQAARLVEAWEVLDFYKQITAGVEEQRLMEVRGRQFLLRRLLNMVVLAVLAEAELAVYLVTFFQAAQEADQMY